MPLMTQASPISEMMTRVQLAVGLILKEHTKPEAVSPASFEALEEAIHGLMRWLADQIVGTWLSWMLLSAGLEVKAIEARRAASCMPLRHRGRRSVTLTLLGGHTVAIQLAQIRPKRLGPGRARGHGKRRESKGHQSMPALEVLGFLHRLSPALARRLALSATACESFQTASILLQAWGIGIDKAQLLRRFNLIAAFIHNAFQAWLRDPKGPSPIQDLDLSGQRVAIVFDGGRCRQRVAKRGRRCTSGHHRFDGSWVEPRQLVVYVLDAKGRRSRAHRAVATATLKAADECMAEIGKLFEAIGLRNAALIVVLGDGARWQWTRLYDLLIALGIDEGKIEQVVDLPHALGHLHTISVMRKSWSEAERKRWLKRACATLKAGRIGALAIQIRALARGRNAKAIRGEIGYFVHHWARMDYGRFRETNLPVSSGVVESMIRQVINLRLKSCGKFWLRERAERLLVLRSWLKVGRFDDLVSFALIRRVSWWPLVTTCDNAHNDDTLKPTRAVG